MFMFLWFEERLCDLFVLGSLFLDILDAEIETREAELSGEWEIDFL